MKNVIWVNIKFRINYHENENSNENTCYNTQPFLEFLEKIWTSFLYFKTQFGTVGA